MNTPPVGSTPSPARLPGTLPSQGAGLAISLVFAVLMTAVIAWLTPALDRFENPTNGQITYDSQLPATERAAHYEWKLDEPTWLSRLSAWGLYGLHQILAWGMIAWGARRSRQRLAAGGARFGDRLDPAGVGFLVVNVVFSLLHLWQTHTFYDGLAQDVAVFTSQGSVIVMLVLILIMQNDRRGLFFGQKIPMPKAAVAFIKQYHGYYIAWALIYTFWFHPTTGTFGHLVGFFYMFALLGQGALIYTRTHVSLKWSAFLEALVLLHGSTVAFVGQQSSLWTMFMSGFGFMFIATQLWGLKLPKVLNWVFTGLFAAVVLLLYSGALGGAGPLFVKNIGQIHQVLWIPATLYLLIPVFLVLAALLAWLQRRLAPGRNATAGKTSGA